MSSCHMESCVSVLHIWFGYVNHQPLGRIIWSVVHKVHIDNISWRQSDKCLYRNVHPLYSSSLTMWTDGRPHPALLLDCAFLSTLFWWLLLLLRFQHNIKLPSEDRVMSSSVWWWNRSPSVSLLFLFPFTPCARLLGLLSAFKNR